MIELDEFELPRKELLRLMFWHPIERYCWVTAYIFVVLVALAVFTADWIPSIAGMIAFLVILPPMHWFYIRSYLPSPKQHGMFQKRKISFDDKMYYVSAEDGSEGKSPLDNIERTDFFCGYYRLFLNKLLFIPIPPTAFRSDDDRRRFETEIFEPKRMKTGFVKRIAVFLFVAGLLLGAAYVFKLPPIDGEYEEQNPALRD